MILDLFRMLIILLIGSNNEPINDLHKRKEPMNFKELNWTFIALAIAMVLFFAVIFIFQIGNEYPNELMSNL